MIAVFGKIKSKEIEAKKKVVRAKSYLDFTSFHQCAMKFVFGPLCICTCLKCYKTKTLQAIKKGEQRGRERGWVAMKILIYFYWYACQISCFCLSTLDPLSLKMISTSRILPNCWKWGKKRGKRLNKHNKWSITLGHMVAALLNS